MKRLSIVMPVLNEAQIIEPALWALQPLRSRGHEVLVADGGSEDGTPNLARPLADQVLLAPRGRASQMNAGVRLARGDVLLFLHADTRLPPEADRLLLARLAETGLRWGRFDVSIEGRHLLLKVVAALMNQRSRLTGICTGDQGIFVYRDLFLRLGGYPSVPLMEDIALCRALLSVSPPLRLRQRVITSGRRWERGGVVRTILLMWWLRLRYFFGASASHLARTYDGKIR